MTITYIFQILEAVVKGDAEKYGVIPDMNGELQKAVRRSRRRVARLRERAQYELGEMDKAKVAAANDNMRRFTKSLGKIRNLNLEDCRGLLGIEDFLEDGNRIHEVMEMAKKIEHMSTVSSTAYTPMSLGFGVLETYTDVAPIEIDNRKFNAGDKEYCLQMIKKLHAFQDSVREVCSRLLDITDYFADGVDSLERIQMQSGGDWKLYTLAQKMQIGRAIQVAQLITLLFRNLMDGAGHVDEQSRSAIKKAQDELLKRDA